VRPCAVTQTSIDPPELEVLLIVLFALLLSASVGLDNPVARTILNTPSEPEKIALSVPNALTATGVPLADIPIETVAASAIAPQKSEPAIPARARICFLRTLNSLD
jgi:hypothetical protein